MCAIEASWVVPGTTDALNDAVLDVDSDFGPNMLPHHFPQGPREVSTADAAVVTLSCCTAAIAIVCSCTAARTRAPGQLFLAVIDPCVKLTARCKDAAR